MDYKIFELNTVNNVRDDMFNSKVKATSPVVEVFSALAQGKTLNGIDKNVADKSVAHIKELAGAAQGGDQKAVSELNAIQRFAIEPKLLEAIRIFDFMGTYHTVSYDTVPMMKTYRYESVDARFQASSGDVPFAAHSFREYPIATQVISSGYAVDYREMQSGNFDGTVAEGMRQVQIDMENKAVYYVIAKLYDAIKNAKGVKHYADGFGITQSSVDDMLVAMRRYGKVNICGDFSVISQMNSFVGFRTFNGTDYLPFGGEAVSEEIRRNGHLSYYNGAYIVELPNALNFTAMKSDKSAYDTYMPQGLLFFIPKGTIAPLQIFRRGGMTTMTGDDIVTRQHLTRFDMEIGAGVAEGLEDWIGLVSDKNYAVPELP